MKHEIEEVKGRNVWQLKVLEDDGTVRDIIEGPFRVVYQWSMDYWGFNPEFKIRRVRPRKRHRAVGERTPVTPKSIDGDAEPEDEVERKPINATWKECMSFFDQIIQYGRLGGHTWEEIYYKLPHGRYAMLAAYWEEYGR